MVHESRQGPDCFKEILLMGNAPPRGSAYLEQEECRSEIVINQVKHLSGYKPK